VKRLFGTDGVRGVANRDLTPDLALALGRAAGSVLAPSGGRFVIGRDTRLSGPMLEAALVAGLCSSGAEVLRAGIVPTPAVAYLTLEEEARGGAVISASHNPVPDNGIKFFSSEGLKTSEDVELQIEEAAAAPPSEQPVGADVGTATDLHDAGDRYVDHLLGSLDGDLEGLRVVLDCAYGAAFHLAPRAFREAGADVRAIHAEPDGSRINVECGSTSMTELSRAVVADGADIGLAFDGDADRVLAVDERGEEVDGDRILGLAAAHLMEEGDLKDGILVATVMSNLGFIRALEERGIEVVAAPVGDKFVAAEMAQRGAVLGGEQSGHVIFSEYSTTGDGILTGLQISSILKGADAPLSKLAHFFEPFPQVLINVPVANRDGLTDAGEVWAAVEKAESSLGHDGRVLLRPSGTEPLIRVMVEAADEGLAQTTADGLADVVRKALG
jgi:phosphoglucosamine mutase